MSKKTNEVNRYLIMGLVLGMILRLCIIGVIFYLTMNQNNWLALCGPISLILFLVHGIATTFLIGSMFKNTTEKSNKWFGFAVALAPVTIAIIAGLGLAAGISHGMNSIG